MSRNHQLVNLRMPPEIFDRLKTNSVVNRRSLTSEVIFTLECYFKDADASEKAPGLAVGSQPDASQN